MEQGYADPTADSWLLKKVIKGIQRCHGVETVKPRLPITMPILRKLVSVCATSSSVPAHDRQLYRAALLLDFYGFMRCAELTSLTMNCLKFKSGNLQVLLKRSKTDQCGRGVYLDIGPAAPPICPVQAMIAYLAVSHNGEPEDPLFMLSTGKPRTRSTLTETVRRLLHAANIPQAELYSGHSFRIGAATTDAMAGIPDSLIRAAGRWRSDVCLRYMRIPTTTKCQLSARLAAVEHHL